jgi:hypothetical protein
LNFASSALPLAAEPVFDELNSLALAGSHELLLAHEVSRGEPTKDADGKESAGAVDFDMFHGLAMAVYKKRARQLKEAADKQQKDGGKTK